MRKCALLLLILFVSLKSFSQQPAYFMFAQEQFEGIDIYNIIQDQEHNYWFATDQGIYFHDGYSFEKIESPEMRSNSVFNFVINSKGVIYCSNLNQQVFQLKNRKCELVFNIPDKGTDINLLINNSDELYISTSAKVYVLNASNALIHTPQFSDESMVGSPFLTQEGKVIQHFSNNSAVLVYHNGGSVIKQLKNFKRNSGADELLHFIRLQGKSYAINNRENRIYAFDENSLRVQLLESTATPSTVNIIRHYTTSENLWLANLVSGLKVYDAQMNPLFNNQTLFSDYLISYVYQDHEGNVLLATFDQGVIVIPNLKNLDVDGAFAGLSVNRLFDGGDRGIFIGARNGGVYNYSDQLKVLSSNSNKGVETIFYWPQQALLFDDTRSLRLHDLHSNGVKSLLMGSLKDAVALDDRTLLIALNSGVYYLNYDPEKKLFSKRDTLSLERGYAVNFEKTNKSIYFATSSGLFFAGIGHSPKALLCKGQTISALDIESFENYTYVATSKQGILVFKNGAIQQQFHPVFNGKELTIFKLKRYTDKLYANTQFGLVIMGLNGKVLHHLNKSAGLSANKIVDFEIYNNELWVAHIRGIQRIKLSSFNQVNRAPTVQLKRILVNNKVGLRSRTNYDHSSRRFEFELSVYTLKNRENIKYWYKLIGVDEEWSVNAYEDNKILYNALGSGKYTLLVKAENNGVFGETIRYPFTIATPFYGQWWFWSIIALLGLGIISLIYRRKLHIQQKKADQRNELNASKLTAIQSQMNPHFIFNSLNSIQDLVLKGDVDNSYTFITKFSNLVRRTLSYSDKDFIDFEQEIKLIELYLSLEKLRFKDEISFVINTHQIEDIQIPPMLIQPFIENALVHGLLHKEGLKTLTLNFEVKDVLYCEIIDNGIGREKALEIKKRQRGGHESFAINAINKRFEILKEHFNNEVGFEYEDLKDEHGVVGTKVILKIPIQRNY